ncbi:hypothetical protein SDC9_151899 [bioreactor metagenome]|uniref:Uncharacterized protein n=1 Tax=bioreactor metagenome TaxID=1076179 RepID=A0A645EW01_9ZZZZ
MQPRRVEEQHLSLPVVDNAEDSVAGGLRTVGNNGHLLPDKYVEQCRLSDVGFTYNGHESGFFNHRISSSSSLMYFSCSAVICASSSGSMWSYPKRCKVE